MTRPEELTLLPLPLLELQLSTIDLLLSMFCLPGEISQSGSTPIATEALRSYLESPSQPPPPLPQSLDLDLNVTVDPLHTLELRIKIPLVGEGGEGDEPPLPVLSLRCPSWMSRKAHTEIVDEMPVDSPDSVVPVVEYLKEAASAYLGAQEAETHKAADGKASVKGSLVRVWFYLQSLSTRSKRDDMVNWAPSYSLTGFVLAGKPGILCLEGASDNISSYMSEIKTRSWSDVPSHQKKVSERFREEGPSVKRVFQDMREVTGEISKGGHRGNRGEMGEVKKMFEDVGLGDVFAEVLGL